MHVVEAVAAIRNRWSASPRAGIILGTGLGELAEQVDVEAIIDYIDIPGFAKSTALAHKGRLICGRLAGVPVAVMQGRVHLYEGYPAQQITLPVRVMKALGAELLIATNASGGLNPRFNSGDVVVMEDHVNLIWSAPTLKTRSVSEGGLERQRGSTSLTDDSGSDSRRATQFAIRNPAGFPYDAELINTALAIARRENFAAHRGVYVAMTGPSYETRAEYRLLRRLGADCVGMSTVPEVLAAVHCGLRVLGLSIVTNVARPDVFEKVDAEEVLHDAASAGRKVQKIILGVLATLTS